MNLVYYIHFGKRKAIAAPPGLDNIANPEIVEVGPVGPNGPSQGEFEYHCIALGSTGFYKLDTGAPPEPPRGV